MNSQFEHREQLVEGQNHTASALASYANHFIVYYGTPLHFKNQWFVDWRSLGACSCFTISDSDFKRLNIILGETIPVFDGSGWLELRPVSSFRSEFLFHKSVPD